LSEDMKLHMFMADVKDEADIVNRVCISQLLKLPLWKTDVWLQF